MKVRDCHTHNPLHNSSWFSLTRVVLICTDDTSNIFPLILLIEKKNKKKKKQKFLWFGFYRENGSSMDGAESLNTNKSSFKANGDLKRKQSEVVSETQYPTFPYPNPWEVVAKTLTTHILSVKWGFGVAGKYWKKPFVW